MRLRPDVLRTPRGPRTLRRSRFKVSIRVLCLDVCLVDLSNHRQLYEDVPYPFYPPCNSSAFTLTYPDLSPSMGGGSNFEPENTLTTSTTAQTTRARTHNKTASPANAHVSQVPTLSLLVVNWVRKSCFPSSSSLQIAKTTHHTYRATAGGAILDHTIHSTSTPRTNDETIEWNVSFILPPLVLPLPIRLLCLKLSPTTSTPLSSTT